MESPANVIIHPACGHLVEGERGHVECARRLRIFPLGLGAAWSTCTTSHLMQWCRSPAQCMAKLNAGLEEQELNELLGMSPHDMTHAP